jgi:hypothetical protein
VPLTERVLNALLQCRLGQDIDRQSWGSAYEDHGLVFARESGERPTRLVDPELTRDARLRAVIDEIWTCLAASRSGVVGRRPTLAELRTFCRLRGLRAD